MSSSASRRSPISATPGQLGDRRVDVVRAARGRRRRAASPARPAPARAERLGGRAPARRRRCRRRRRRRRASSSAERRPAAAARPPYCSASRAALACVRLRTTRSPTPRRGRVATASDAIAPAPTTTRAPARRAAPTCCSARVERDRDQRRRGAVDVGLGVGALGDAERLLERGVERRADRAELLAEAERLAGLAEDLALADDHRVEPGGDVEEVRDRAVVVVDVEVRDRPRRPVLLRQVAQRLADRLDAAVEPVDVGVDLDPVAGGQDGGLLHVVGRRARRVTSFSTPAGSSASRSSRSTGAVWWETPTTRTLMRSPPRRSGVARGAPCAARGRRGSAARSRGRPCARRRRRGR